MAILSATWLPGCATHAGAIAGEMAGEVPEPLIQESLRTLADDETQELIAEVLGMPAVQDATRELIGNVTDGAIEALTNEERAARLTELSQQFVARVSDTLADVIERDIGPAMVQTLTRALDASLRRILSDETIERMSQAVALVAQQSAAALAVAVREELGPALRAALREDLGPALREAMASPETQEVIADTTRTMSRGMVLGVQDAFEEIEAREGPQQTNTILTRLQDFAGGGLNILQFALAALALALLVALLFLVRAIAKAREHEAEAHRREAAMIALTEAIKNTEDRPWSRELLDLLKDSFRDNEHADYLRDVLRRNRHLRVGGRDRDVPGGASGPLEPQGT
ncbi:MAG: hypothetical protein M3Y87_19620 [Myxococcota bacterium]|nr:hypothetical protein [Myxococcota bacterium]